jgi:hypothetical protein
MSLLEFIGIFLMDNEVKNVDRINVMRIVKILPLLIFALLNHFCTLGSNETDKKAFERALVSEFATNTVVRSGNSNNSTTNFRIGGNIAGLSGIVFLQNNAAEQAPFNISGRFFFPRSYAEGSNYVITVSTQPAGQTCTVANGFGRVSGSDITDIIVNCVTN